MSGSQTKTLVFYPGQFHMLITGHEYSKCQEVSTTLETRGKFIGVNWVITNGQQNRTMEFHYQ